MTSSAFSYQKLDSWQTLELTVLQDDLSNLFSLLVSHKIPFQFSAIKEQQSVSSAEAVLPRPHFGKVLKQDVESEKDALSRIYDEYFGKDFILADPSEAEIAQKYGKSLNTFRQHFKQKYGKSFCQLYMEKKMEHAAFLLRQGLRANRVSKMVGYGQKSAIKFNKMFQKHFGTTPKNYQLNNSAM